MCHLALVAMVDPLCQLDLILQLASSLIRQETFTLQTRLIASSVKLLKAVATYQQRPEFLERLVLVVMVGLRHQLNSINLMMLLLMHQEMFILQTFLAVSSERLPAAVATSQQWLAFLRSLVIVVMVGLQHQLNSVLPRELLLIYQEIFTLQIPEIISFE